MQGFEDVTFEWGGKTFVVPANRQMMLIARVEDALSGDTGLQALSVLLRPEGPPYSRLAAAFGAALRYAGATVSDEEIYLTTMNDFAAGRAEVAERNQRAVVALLSVIAPPFGHAVDRSDETDEAEKKD